MNSIMETNVLVKKKCPYMEKCYRKNPIHFNEMSHPHLEKLLNGQLDGNINVPAKLDFECADRSQLLDQLKVLQMVLRKAKERANVSDSTTQSNHQVNKQKNTCTTTRDDSTDLKEKVEKHKAVTAKRRMEKLLEMDANAKKLSEESESENKRPETTGVSKVRTELNDLKIAEEKLGNNTLQGKKRASDTPNDNSCTSKKSKTGSGFGASNQDREKNKQSSSVSQQSSSKGSGTSLFDLYQSCDSRKTREETRQKAIKTMKQQGYKISVVEPGEFAIKYALSAPYHMFFTRIEKSQETYDQQYSITFPEILDNSLGEIVSSLHINFMVDVGWLCLQYLLAGQRTDMLILLGERCDEEQLPLNISTVTVQMPTKFGCHHSKVMIFKYKDNGIRIVVSTANLYSDDWENRTQGLWISPHLPPLRESANTSDGESPTGFRKDLERYLSKYRLPVLTEWLALIRKADFSEVNVFFIASVPGSHKDTEYEAWGHRKLGQVLAKHATLPPDAPQWPIVAQSSSIGSLGPNYESWLLKEIVPSMSRETAKGMKSHPNFQFIYPSIKNFKSSFDCRNGSCCLPYSIQTHSKQEWVEAYLYQWKASRTKRDKAMPHIKSYTRFSPDFKKIPWFVLTSANLSKAAWGTSRASNYIMSYEAGVAFIPKIITKTETFPILEEDPEMPDVPVFPMHYDLPLTRYESGDKPFVTEFFAGFE